MGNICRWTDDETDSHVMGSGATQWEWYNSCIEFDDERGVYAVEMESPDGECVEYTFTRSKVRSMVTKTLMGKTGIEKGSLNYGYFKNDDPDAGAMDSLIQLIVYGEIVYG